MLRKYGLSVSDYIINAKNLAYQLAATGNPISENDLLLYVLNVDVSVSTLHNHLEGYERMLLRNSSF